MSDEYYSRILPIVGRGLMAKSLALVNADFCCLVADALARCGVTTMTLPADRTVSAADAIPATFGLEHVGQPASEALLRSFSEQNGLERDWSIRPSTAVGADIVIGGGDLTDCRETISIALDLGVPAVTFTLFENAPMRCGVFVSGPGLANAAAVLERPGVGEKLSGYTPERRLDWLEASDMAMAAARALLLRGTEYARPDFERLLIEEGRTVILRGTAVWPWLVAWCSPQRDTEWIANAVAPAETASWLPPEMYAHERVMVVGCGTASLFVGEALNWFRDLMLVDCKAFSAYNPVRQLAGTAWVGRPKPLALQEILVRRIEPDHARRRETESDGVRTLCAADVRISAAMLEVRDETRARFEALLDVYEPSLVIVAMGRSGEDDANYTVTRILRARGIRHVVPTAFPSAAYYKNIVVDRARGPCYDCLHHHLPVDVGAAPTLTPAQEEMFYGGTQPATVMETYPSAHALLRLSLELCLPDALRSPWFAELVREERTCLVGGNRAERAGCGWLYGIRLPGQVVAYGTDDIVGCEVVRTCVCGRVNQTRHVLEE